MTFLWRKTDDEEGWVATELNQSVVIDSNTNQIVEDTKLAQLPSSKAIHIHHCGGQPERWVLLAEPGPYPTINGESTDAGIRALSDRDAIRVAAQSVMYFSTEKPPRAEPYPGPDPVFCPRCKLPVGHDDLAVRCPGCRIWHHHSDTAESCWQYADTCALCDQPTELDHAEFAWTPGDL